LGAQIKKNEMGGSCGRYGGQTRCIHGKTILKCILKNGDEETGTGLLWLRTGTSACEHGSNTLGSIKCGEFFD